MTFLGGFKTYNGKAVPKLIYHKIKLGLENIKSCMVQDEHKVRIYKEYLLPANCFILSIHDLTNTDLKKLDDLKHRYLKSWRYILGWVWMWRVSCIFTTRAGLWTLLGHRCERTTLFGLQREPRFSMSRSGPGNLPFLFVRLKLRGPFCHLRNLQLAMLLLLNSPWPSMTLIQKIPSHLRPLYMHNLGILTFHCTQAQLWNQVHNRRRLSPFQHKLTLSQKCWPSARRSGEFFVRKRMMHGLLASATIPCKETSLLFCRLRVSASLGSLTCGISIHGFLKFALNASIDTLPTFTNLNCHA
jgi:hypothetical protein